VVESITASVSGGKWTSAALATALADGEYTAVAGEPSSLGNAEGKSSPATFVVDTKPPIVTLNEPPSPSGVVEPSFSGTASEAEPVTVKVYKGSKAEGAPIATLGASVSAQKWQTAALGSPLADGVYTAIASEPSSIGNGTGTSEAATFVVSTASPSVSMAPVPTPSNNATPSFTGEAGETEPVTVKIYKGPSPEGAIVRSVVAAVSNRAWASEPLGIALEDGQYTAIAIEPSSIGNAAGKSAPVTFVVDTKPPVVTLNAVVTPSKVTKPSFSGTAAESEPVTVRVYSGAKAEGAVVESVTASVSGGKWTSAALATGLADGEYTAVAGEPSGLGNAEGKSSAVTFVVDTLPPVVALNAITTPSKVNKPSFSGSASESEPVTVRVYSGGKAEGAVVASVTASVSGGKWTSAALGSVLADGEYTAVAGEPSGLGNAEGRSAAVTFVVNTKAPTVVLNAVVTPSKNTKPSFSGTASESEPVTVKIYKGAKAEGTQVAGATASVSGGKWSTAALGATLADGEYTAIAAEPSGLGNAEGKSGPVTFVVDTLPPVVTLNAVVTPSKNTKPSFSGTASEAEPVTVRVYSGPKAEGAVVASVTASVSGGKWASAALATALADGEYTAVAGEPSGLGNAEGKSAPVMFVVNTKPPTVIVNEVPSPSNAVKPSFTGTASESEPVTVKVYKGSKAEGTPVATVVATVSSGKWASPALSTPLADGLYTVIASEPSSLGNATGQSPPVAFVVDTAPPNVSMNPVKTPSNNAKPSFSGEAGETEPVTIKIYRGAKAEGTLVTSVTAQVSARVWSSEALAGALEDGEYTAVASEPSSIGNAEGHSAPVVFVINRKPPIVVLKAPPTPSRNTKPSFTGTASESEPVTVSLYRGSKAEGAVVASVVAQVSEGRWETAMLSEALQDGEYTAVAGERSSLGNAEGKSAPVVFTVNTKPPMVVLSEVATPSKVTRPSFNGTSSESEPVTVDVYSGTKAEGALVASVTASVSAGSWTSASLGSALQDGQYTAVALEPSAIGNAEGRSNTVSFTVDTLPPKVGLNPVPALSNNTKPAFSGTASETPPVTVRVYAGAKAEGSPVATVEAQVSEGKWSSPGLAAALSEGEYTALAGEPSGLGNAEGKSSAVSFVVRTKPPTVTLRPVNTPSNNGKPSFSGTASEALPVTVRVYAGATAEGTPVASVEALVGEGKWSSAALAAALADGEYTAVAGQPSSLGNPEGYSPPVTFVVNTKPPVVTLKGLPGRSGNTRPKFEGTASEALSVTVRIFKGASAQGIEVATLKAAVVKGEWSSAPVSAALLPGQYTALATEPSSIGNTTGESPTVTFEVVTGVPAVSLKQPVTPSNDTTPSFSGTASESSPVTVKVYEGTRAEPEAPLVATVTAEVKVPKGAQCSAESGCSWVSGVIPELPGGKHTYTAVATENSENGIGESAPVTFTVNTLPPSVTIEPVKSPSKNTAPGFHGTASEAGAVTVEIFKGKVEGKPFATVTASTPGGEWRSASSALSKLLEDGEYTAVAVEPSAIKNASGRSTVVSLIVDTRPPLVTVEAPASPSAVVKPTFAGTASEGLPVTVHVYRGRVAPPYTQPEVASPKAEVVEGQWVSEATETALEGGEYTAVATQESSIGNGIGESTPVTFTIELRAPTVSELGSSFTRTSALLNGSVQAQGGTLGACRFEYGTTRSFGRTAECAFSQNGVENCAFSVHPTAECVFPSDHAVAVYARLDALTPGTTYYFRLLAENEGGRTGSQEGALTTAPAIPSGKSAPTQPKGPVSSQSGPTTAEIGALIGRQLAPTGRTAAISALLRKGLFSALFKAPVAGTAAIGWYYLPRGAKFAKSQHGPKPVLVASGQLTFHSATTATIKLHLSPAGKRLLRRAAKLRLTARCVFAPTGKAPITMLKSFELRH